MPARIEIVIRADAGSAIGTGHFGRAAAVADALQVYEDVAITLVTCVEAAPFVQRFFGGDVNVITFAEGADHPNDVLTALDDAPAAIYLDHYGQVSAWEEATARAGIPLALIDDLDVAHAADLIIRPVSNGNRSAANIYAGPAFLPLGKHVVAVRMENGVVKPHATHVHVCFGGSDPTGETRKALDALASLQQFQATVVIGPGAELAPVDLSEYAALPHITLSFAPSQAQIAAQLMEADIAIGAGGVMQWERLCIGVPSCVVAVAANQLPQVRLMAERGAIACLGDHNAVTAQDIGAALEALADDRERRRNMIAAGQQLVDGRGALRVAAGLRALCLDVRDVVLTDGPDLFAWRTDPANWVFNHAPNPKPSLDDHLKWLGAKLAADDVGFYLISDGDTPIGVVRFDLHDDQQMAALSIYLVPQAHGRKLGLATYMAAERALRAAFPAVTAVTSEIHRANDASKRLHLDAGFVLVAADHDPDWLNARRDF